jgi:uncharacterized protein YecT (DUF1311 family)
VDQAARAGGSKQKLTLHTRSVIIVTTAALFGAAVFARAEDEKECNGSTYDVVMCQKANLAILERRLAAAYREALKFAQGKERAQLEKAQQAWLKFRNADCDYYELGEGTIARIRGGNCMLDLTRARTKELEQAVEP